MSTFANSNLIPETSAMAVATEILTERNEAVQTWLRHEVGFAQELGRFLVNPEVHQFLSALPEPITVKRCGTDECGNPISLKVGRFPNQFCFAQNSWDSRDLATSLQIGVGVFFFVDLNGLCKVPGVGFIECGPGVKGYAMNPIYVDGLNNGNCNEGIRRAYANRAKLFDPTDQSLSINDLSLSHTFPIECIKVAVQNAAEKITQATWLSSRIKPS